MPSRSGLEPLVAGHLHADRVIAIAGESAAELGEQLARAGAAPLAIEADRFALLSSNPNPPAVGRVRDLPPNSVDLVILRRAWHEPTDVPEAMAVARAVVRPGGEVVAADIDVNRLLDGPSPRYPARLLYLGDEVAASRLGASTASPGLLGVSAVRIGLARVESFTYDDVLGEYDDTAGLWAGLVRRGWRGEAWVSSEGSGALFRQVADTMGQGLPAGWAVDREPWYAVFGAVR